MSSPSRNPLPASLSLGDVHLTVSDLQKSVSFYQSALGLTVQEQSDGTAWLGVGDAPLLGLTENQNAIRVARTTGLYHFALLVPSRPALGDFLQNLIDSKTPIQGVADHNVSEAIYLPDPDGNGIEVYRDRPQSEWQYNPDGSIVMGNAPLDAEGILSEGSGATKGVSDGTVLGHMHLHVADLPPTLIFYRDVLGFDLMLDWGGQALFMSAGGYHHHIGLNTWNGIGAPPPPANSVGLRYFSVRIPQDGFDDLRLRLEKAGVPHKLEGGEISVQDSAQNGIKFVAVG